MLGGWSREQLLARQAGLPGGWRKKPEGVGTERGQGLTGRAGLRGENPRRVRALAVEVAQAFTVETVTIARDVVQAFAGESGGPGGGWVPCQEESAGEDARR